MLQDVNTSLELRNPEIQISILRDRAAALGVSPQQIESALYNAYGGRRISTLYGATDQYSVLLELHPRFQRDINALRSLFVQSSSGQMVPVSAVADIKIERRARFGESLRTAAVGGAVVQSGARRVDWRRGHARSGARARDVAERRFRHVRRQREGVRAGVPHAASTAARSRSSSSTWCSRFSTSTTVTRSRS